MSLKSLQNALLSHMDGKKSVSAGSLQDHFADLIINPSYSDPKVPFELSDELRKCIFENDPINRVYETIDRILTLRNTPEGIWDELRELSETYSDQGKSFRISKIRDGSTFRNCFRVVTYMRAQGMIPDVGAFFRDVEESYATSGIRAYAHNEYLLLAADLYSDLFQLGGYSEDLKELFGVRRSNIVLRAVEGETYA